MDRPLVKSINMDLPLVRSAQYVCPARSPKASRLALLGNEEERLAVSARFLALHRQGLEAFA
jgi:hypothetical protein